LLQITKRSVIRSVGVANLIIGAAGLVIVSNAVLRVGLGSRYQADSLYFPIIFRIMCAISLIWFLLLSASGIQLWRLNYRAYVLFLSLCSFQILYEILFGLAVSFFPTPEARFQFGVATKLAFVVLRQFYVLSYAFVLLIVSAIFLRKEDFREDSVTDADNGNDSPSGISRLWPGYISLIRILGVVNILFGSLGIALVVLNSAYFALHRQIIFAKKERSVALFVVENVVNFGFVVSLSVAGYLLTKLKRKGYVVSIYVLAAELLYWFGVTLIPLSLSGATSLSLASIGRALDGFTDFGILPQILTGYPVLGFFLLLLAGRQIERYRKWQSPVRLKTI
jgi:hypothetical protein